MIEVSEQKAEAVERFSSSNIMWSLDGVALTPEAGGEWVRHTDHATTISALVAERDDLATKWQQAIAIGMLHAERATTAESERDEARERAGALELAHERELSRAIREITTLRPALAAANARVERLEKAMREIRAQDRVTRYRGTEQQFYEDGPCGKIARAALTGGENGEASTNPQE